MEPAHDPMYKFRKTRTDYQKAVDTVAYRVQQNAGRIQLTDDPAEILALSKKLRRAARDLLELTHDHVAANSKRRPAADPPHASEGEP